MNRIARPALAVGGGFLVALSLPPWGFWPLAVVGVMAFEIALGDRPSPRRRAGYGFAFGIVWMAMGMGWMWQLTMPGYVVATSIFAGFHAFAAWVAPVGAWRAIGRPAAHTLVEALRFSFPFGGVPLASLGISQAGGPLLGLARVVGVIGLTWVVFQIGVSLAGPSPAVPRLVRRRRPGASGAPHGVLGLAAVVVLVVLAAVAPQGSPTGETITVAAVQGGGEQGTRAIDVPSSVVTERHLEATASIEPDPELDLVVWPENAIDVDDQRFEDSEVFRAIAAEAARLGVPFAVGVTEDAEYSGLGEPGQVTNAQVVVTPEGELISRYDKVRRVPFGEYVPLRDVLETLGAPVDQVPTNAVPGEGPAVVELPDGTPVAVVISWEVFFGGRAREGVKAGGELIVNPTNGASYTGTILQTQQIASSRLRAVENGRALLQVAPTGFSAFVSADGSVRQRTAISEQAVIVGEIELRDGFTWYTSLGDGPIIAAVLVLFATAWWFGGGRRWIDARRSGRAAGAPSPAAASDLEQDGDRAVVHQLDAHLRAEPAGGDVGAAPA